ncbi:MAG: hypothetical protein J7L64_08530 [Acidobacteria bacterium]|nr:hypothetical protein [Acidobacteriota bacterium]
MKKILFWFCSLLIPLLLFSAEGYFRFSGEVKGTVYILIRGNGVRIEPASFGASVRHPRFSFSEPLPLSEVPVYVRKLSGRGPVSIEEQPSRINSYTVKVLILASEHSLSERYEFELVWGRMRPRFGSNYPSSSQPVDSFRWWGTVDGKDIIKIRGERVWVEHRSALPIQNQDYRFSAPLPFHPVPLALEVVKGRGRVMLIEQPSEENGYTASVLVDDESRRGSARYEFVLWWTRPQGMGIYDNCFFHWEGKVDGSDRIILRRDEVKVEHLTGLPLQCQSYTLSAPLRSRRVTVSLRKKKGRGKVTIVEQPSARNGYRVVVLVDDSRRRGASDYSFDLSWRDDTAPSYRRKVVTGKATSFSFDGVIDGEDLIVIKGAKVEMRHISGKRPIGAAPKLFFPLPRREIIACLRKKKGRGEVVILEQPSARNDYSLIVRIRDEKRGASRYRFSISW